MSKKYFEWSHQLRLVHDDSTIDTRQKKKLTYCRGFVYIFRFSCHGARVTVVLLSCHCRTTVAQQSWVTCAFDSELLVYKAGPINWVIDLRGDFLKKFFKHTRLHPNNSNEITGRFTLRLLHQCTILPKTSGEVRSMA